MKRNVWWKKWLIGALVVIVAYVGWCYFRPLPKLKPESGNLAPYSTPAPVLAWPAVGQSAVGVVGTNILETHGQQKPAPTASTAKIIACLLVLKQKPLSQGQQGPVITLTAADKAIYDAYVAKAGSTVPVQAGEQISEYQMLQAILLPSANNMADSLAIWAYGSLPAYSAAANAYVKQLGLTGTTVGSDASGFNPSTVSTAADLVKLGELAMQNPVLAGIVGQSTATGIPAAGTIKNVNSLLANGLVGVKTGNTDQAGGVFIGAIKNNVLQKPVIIVSALVGAPNLAESLKQSLPLLQSAQVNFRTDTPVHANDFVGSYKVPWGKSVRVMATQNLALTTWNGTQVSRSLKLNPIKSNSEAGEIAGSITSREPVIGYQTSVDVKLESSPPQPKLIWRLTHPIP